VSPAHRQADGSPPFAPIEPARTPLSRLEIAILWHVGSLLLLGSWAFGGGTAWARTALSVWGSMGWLITLAAIRPRLGRADGSLRPLHWLWPLAAFNVLALVSCLNPSFSTKFFEGQSLLAHTGAAHRWLPSTAHPPATLAHLWLFDAAFLSCFNLVWVAQRRALRGLLLAVCANAVLLSVFGTFQNLTSDGLFFGLVPSPNPRFFATFIYGNHWAAYIVLLIGAGLGLVFHYTRHHPAGQLSGSPLATGIVGLLLMAMTPTICGSRSGTLLVMILLGIAAGHALLHALRGRQALGGAAMLPIGGLMLGVALIAAGAATYLGRATLRERWSDTQGQWRAGLAVERLKLYADTWHLAAAHPYTGWGLGCYDKALLLLRPRPLEARRQYEHSYVDAHSDWLQSLAEVGVAGTLLAGLCGLLPLLALLRRKSLGALPGYLLAGCGLILLYAGVEFPFGNPAVVVAFWTCFFCAVHYGRLLDNKPRIEPPSDPARAP
jgi:hypothetical protein